MWHWMCLFEDHVFLAPSFYPLYFLVAKPYPTMPSLHHPLSSYRPRTESGDPEPAGQRLNLQKVQEVEEKQRDSEEGQDSEANNYPVLSLAGDHWVNPSSHLPARELATQLSLALFPQHVSAWSLLWEAAYTKPLSPFSHLMLYGPLKPQKTNPTVRHAVSPPLASQKAQHADGRVLPGL